MARLLQNDQTGELVWQNDQGNIQQIEEPGLLGQAGRQFADIGSGIKYLYGDLTDQPELVNQARLETAERNRLFAPADAAYPYQSMIGQAMPGLATAPMGGFFTNIALGAGESALDLGEGGDMASRAAAGGVGAFLGDMGGRAVGRIWNMASGLAKDIAGYRLPAENPAAQEFERLGGKTLAYQRMERGSRPELLAKRAAQGAEAAMNPTRSMADVMQFNDDLFRQRAVEAIGLNPDRYPILGRQFVNDALDYFQEGFSEVASRAAGQGGFELPEITADKLRKLPEIKELIDLGEFEGLASGNVISGAEWMAAREALSEAAATRFQNGRSRAGEKIMGMVDDLDADMGRYVPEEFLPAYARLREQYRVFRLLEKPNVISNDGQINVATFRDKLDSKTQGFGRTATSGGATTNDETRGLIDLMQAADNPEFKAFRSSGTAENLQLGLAIDQGTDAARDLVAGDPRAALGFAGRLLAPSIIGASQMGEGQMFRGAFTPNVPLRMAGQAGGRSLLDELMYPFVGVDDEREIVR